ncbi:hypothetical protein K443DRAFT_258726 [Laccaria amethystina LaAM-08-1]|uniref:Uncharacterized protein n=1 Tax=Laccaria amethystina LaAM-08-1 TaxID=1095629 RepID=A0A0C9WLB1_9AGAR|nr:hypothetical protein K443DRAFT_258726 [Laccaria amethystina LaAM-08-1]
MKSTSKNPKREPQQNGDPQFREIMCEIAWSRGPRKSWHSFLTGNLKSSTMPSAARRAHPASITSFLTMEGDFAWR